MTSHPLRTYHRSSRRNIGRVSLLCTSFALLAGCATAPIAAPGGDISPATPTSAVAAPFPSTYTPLPSTTTAIVNASILTATGNLIEIGTIVMDQGTIVAVGTNVTPPANATVIDGTGKWVTPGIIDSHSHLGVFPAPGVQGHADGNENIDPYTAHVWAEHSLWPQDPVFTKARAGGVTSLLILP